MGVLDYRFIAAIRLPIQLQTLTQAALPAALYLRFSFFAASSGPEHSSSPWGIPAMLRTPAASAAAPSNREPLLAPDPACRPSLAATSRTDSPTRPGSDDSTATLPRPGMVSPSPLFPL